MSESEEEWDPSDFKTEPNFVIENNNLLEEESS